MKRFILLILLLIPLTANAALRINPVTGKLDLTGDTSGGSGDITTVGDCVSGGCLDGSSSAGTYIRLYDGDSNYGAFVTANLAATRTYTFPDTTGTVALTSGNIATATALAANGANCSAGSFPLGVDASGVTETCTALPTTIAGTALEITSSASTGAITLSLPTSIDLGGKTSFEVPNAAAPTVDAFGEIAGDNNFFGASRGALVAFDGTSTVGMVGILSTDTCANGEVAKFNTGGTWTCETDSSAGTTAITDIADATADGTIATTSFQTTITSTIDHATVNTTLTLSNTDADNANDTFLMKFKFTDDGDTNSYAMAGYDNAGADLAWYIKGDGTAQFGTGNGTMDVGAAGVRLSSDGDGAITLLGLGDGSDEDLTLNLDDTSNTGVFSSSTGLTVLDFGTIGVDFDSGTLKIPASTSQTPAAAGQIGIDTTGDQLKVYGGAVRVITYKKSKSFVIDTPTASSDYKIWRTPDNITITAIHVLCTGGTNIIGGLDEADSNGANASAIDSDITGTDGANVNDDGTLSNATVDANDYINWHTTSISGTPTSVTITFEYTTDAT